MQPIQRPAAPATAAHGAPIADASRQRLHGTLHPPHAPQTTVTATTHQQRSSEQAGWVHRASSAAAGQQQQQAAGQGLEKQPPPPSAVVSTGRYCLQPPVGGPHIRSIFMKPDPATAAPAGAGSAATTLQTTAEGGAHGKDAQCHRTMPGPQGPKQSASVQVAVPAQSLQRPPAGQSAEQMTSCVPQRVMLPPPDATFGGSRPAHVDSHSNGNPAAQTTYRWQAGDRQAHSAPAAALAAPQHRQYTALPEAKASVGAARPAHQVVRSAPAAASQLRPPAGSAQQQLKGQQEQRQQQQQQQQKQPGSASVFREFECRAHLDRSGKASVPAAAAAAEGVNAAPARGATKQQSIAESIVRGGGTLPQPAPPPARPGNEMCWVEIQLGAGMGTLEVHAKERYLNDVAQAAMLR